MEAKLQRRVQRYGWDLAASEYEPLWRTQLVPAQAKLLDCAALAPGERVLDVACGTGLVTFAAAGEVGARGTVVGIDISGRMVETARRRVARRGCAAPVFERMDAEALSYPSRGFDVVLCSLGLMYMPHPEQVLFEVRRVLRPGGRFVAAVWGERARCGWAELFPIIDAEVESEVCPLFFRLGQDDTLARLCDGFGFQGIEQHRIEVTLDYRDPEDACNAAFAGGPVALAWSRFRDDTRERVRNRYLDAIRPWKTEDGYRVPGEFVVVSATAR